MKQWLGNISSGAKVSSSKLCSRLFELLNLFWSLLSRRWFIVQLCSHWLLFHNKKIFWKFSVIDSSFFFGEFSYTCKAALVRKPCCLCKILLCLTVHGFVVATFRRQMCIYNWRAAWQNGGHLLLREILFRALFLEVLKVRAHNLHAANLVPKPLWAKTKPRSDQIRFVSHDRLPGMWQARQERMPEMNFQNGSFVLSWIWTCFEASFLEPAGYAWDKAKMHVHVNSCRPYKLWCCKTIWK